MGFFVAEYAPEPSEMASAPPCPAKQTKKFCWIKPSRNAFCIPILSAKYWDADTKTLAYQLRDYGPGMGRWMSRDPLGLHHDISILDNYLYNNINIKKEYQHSIYLFNNNNPGKIDVLGLGTWEIKVTPVDTSMRGWWYRDSPMITTQYELDERQQQCCRGAKIHRFAAGTIGVWTVSNPNDDPGAQEGFPIAYSTPDQPGTLRIGTASPVWYYMYFKWSVYCTKGQWASELLSETEREYVLFGYTLTPVYPLHGLPLPQNPDEIISGGGLW